ncbi:unnamed protein product [Linum trigynum]|uniref:Uncharacterized protein n=1 Tax=Linum trigynum TaxID=586398 RepID=A0AAV2GCD2_9ROSI
MLPRTTTRPSSSGRSSNLLIAALRPAVVSAEVNEELKQTRILQFLMQLSPEFKAHRSRLVNQDGLSMDGILGQLIREEKRLRT